MLSDEEKKALENLKIEYEKLIKEDNILFPLYKNEAKRLINLIEKQSKDIEDLTTNQLDLKDKCIKIAKKLEEDNKNFVAEYILAQIGACPVWECGESYSNYISKDKIKAKIEEAEERLKKANCLLDCKTKFKVIFKIETEIEALKELLEKE